MASDKKPLKFGDISLPGGALYVVRPGSASLRNGSVTNFDRIVGMDKFEDFARHYRGMVLHELTVTQKRQFIQKFIKKVEVGVKTYKVHFNMDQEHYQRELALREASSRPVGAGSSGSQIFFGRFGSNTLTNGAP